jgi:hypothetical protein
MKDRVMNTPKTIPILALTACSMAICGTAFAETSTRLYRNHPLQIEFRLPLGWQVTSCDFFDKGTVAGCLALWPRSHRNSSESAIEIQIRHVNLEEAASGHDLFEKIDGVWVKHGRSGETHEAATVSGSNWQGIEAETSCGISIEGVGFSASAGVCHTAILSNGISSAIVETDGVEDTIDTANIIEKNFRFTE